jgi:predicted ATPase/DNA-binding CsgD family transcriptional regulator
MVGAAHNLPYQTSSFVGRQRELAKLREWLVGSRLVTLVGAGGCGKTRLALELARDCLPHYPEGVRLVDLSPLSDGALVAQALARTLDIHEEIGRDWIDTLVSRLGAARLLVLLDNCEHLRPAAAEAAHALLSGCGSLQVLATSREPLNLPGESIFRVPPLTAEEAVELFAVRARQAGAMDEGQPEVVEDICRRLDMMPLAIELAAARARAMTSREILRRLDDRFRLLRGGSQVAPARQQTLRATIEWSYALLTPQERALSDRLAIFAGGFTVAAAEQVCADSELLPVDVSELLERLVDRSLLVPEVSAAGETRYSQLETVREYARERLSWLPEADAIARRHAAHFEKVAERARPELMTGEVGPWLQALVEEADNLRAALDWCHEHEPGWELRMALTLFAFWLSRGFVAEGRRRLAGILAKFPDPNLDRALALSASGRLASRQNDFEAAEASLHEALVIQRRSGNPRGVARAQRELGLVLAYELRYDEARPLLEEAVASARATGEPSMLAAALDYYGFLAAATDDPAGARLVLVESVAIRRQLGQRYPAAFALLTLGRVLVSLGELDQAEQALDEALAVLREVGDLAAMAIALLIVSVIAARRGLGQRAAVLKGAAHQIGDRSGSSAPPWRDLWFTDMEAADPGDLVSDLDRLVATATDGRVALAATRPKLPQLSGREAQVAGLVAEGLSNRKIGVALHISERTVETHVQHILNKLAFHSRSQIAAWVAGRTVGSA